MTYDQQQLEKLTKTELVQIIIEQAETIMELESRLTALEKDSSNSSKPPSTDFHTKRTKSLRQKSRNKSGAQQGHKGIARMQVKEPDTIISLRPNNCENCNNDLTNTEGKVTARRQEADIPPIEATVTEYQQETVVCNECGKENKRVFPEHITAPFQIGENLKAMIVYLNIAHHIPFARCTQILKDLLSVHLSEGALDNALTKAHEKAKSLYPQIMEEIKKAKWAGSDETGTKINGKTVWKWVWQTLQASYYTISKSRGYDVVKEHFSEDYTGILVHDSWSAQNNTTAGAHQHCHPHYLRDLQFSIDIERSAWAYEAMRFLYASERARKIMWTDDFDEAQRYAVIVQYKHRLEELVNRPIVGKEAKRIQKRMKKHQEKILFFMGDPDIPFDNNSSERAIRNAKLHKKISGGFRSDYGAERHAVLLSIIETCKKREMDVFGSLKLMFQGKLSFQSR
jgi:transposase